MSYYIDKDKNNKNHITKDNKKSLCGKKLTGKSVLPLYHWGIQTHSKHSIIIKYCSNCAEIYLEERNKKID